MFVALRYRASMKVYLLLILPLTTVAFSTRPLSLSPSTKKQHRQSNSRHQLRELCNNLSEEVSSWEETRRRSEMKILGICGGIGSGKSTACELMVDALGCAARIGEFIH